MVYNLLNLPILCEMADSNTGKTAVDFETFDKDTLADEAEGGYFFKDTVVGGFVQSHSVLSLILDLSLGPLLLLCCLPP